MRNLYLSVPLACVLAVAAPDASRAAFLSIDDTAANETITISANDFEYGLSVNGGLVQQGLGNPANITLPESGPITIAGSWEAPGGVAPLTRTMFLVEPNDPTLISDIWQYTLSFDGIAHLSGVFTSDAESGLGRLTGNENPADVFVEGGDVPFSAAFLEGHVSSDVEAVPEPATLAILGLGFAGLGVMRRRRAA